tara:strand:- start:160 stop:537 length:378 start_codon:yes stop_codon:yes gene_type:complete
LKIFNFNLKKSQRLIKSSLFKDTFEQNNKWVGKYMVLWVREAPDADLKIGIISSKKVHNKAYKRNRSRRYVREIYRKIRHKIIGNNDIVIVIRKALLSATWNEVYDEMSLLLSKAGLLEESHNKN